MKVARAYRRRAGYAPDALPKASGGGGPALRSDEVSRHAVRLVVIDRASDGIDVAPFASLSARLRAGDLVVVNDAATLPASLRGCTAAGAGLELRLSAPVDGNHLHCVLLGEGDHRTRTENRPPPPTVCVGDRLVIGRLHADVIAVAGRRVELIAREADDVLWQALYASGKPVQYAHRAELLPLWAVQTAYAARPWAAEMPSAGRPLTWDVLLGLRRAGIGIATLTHAAGLSSTGDDELDHALPWPERYEIPRKTVDAITDAKARGSRVIAIGTTVVRALESAALAVELEAGDHGFATPPMLVAGSGVATLRLDPTYEPRIVDGLVSGLHAPDESHFELLAAFAPREQLVCAIELAAAAGLSGHELGDACLIL